MTGGRALVAVDLDQTLIFSARHQPAGGPALRVVEHLQGRPAAVMTERAWDLLEVLVREHDVVPVTTRTTEQLRRVILPAGVRWSICANGGRLVAGGCPVAEWDDWAHGVASAAAPLAEAEHILARADDGWVRLRRSAEQLFCYLVARDAAGVDEVWLGAAARWADAYGWTVSRQGRKVYLVPAGLDKGTAAQRLRSRLDGARPLLAAGDSLLDAGMLLAADAAVRPCHGELERRPEAVPGVAVVGGAGAASGEAVLAWLADAAADVTAPLPVTPAASGPAPCRGR